MLPTLRGIRNQLEALRGDVARTNARVERSEQEMEEIERRQPAR